jgi:hypothetical protein
MDGEVPLEDKVPAVFDLIDGVFTLQVYGFAVLLRKLGGQKPTPVIQPFLDDGSAQFIGAPYR